MRILEVETIEYDEMLPAEAFVFAPPASSSTSRRRERVMTTVDAAAARASFRVFRLNVVPPEWGLQVTYVAATEQPTLPESVTILYSRRDRSASLRIHQTATAHSLPATGRERYLQRRGRDYVVLGPDNPDATEQADLILALEGTQIRMSSAELALEQLLTLAHTLVGA